MDQLTVQEKIGANYMLLELSGAMDSFTITELQNKVYSSIIDTNVVFDLSQITSLDSSGISVIFAAHNDGEKYNTKLFLMNPSDVAREALDRTGFMDTFNVIHSVTEVSDAI